MFRKLCMSLAVIALLALVASGCAPAPTEIAAAPPTTVVATAAPTDTPTPPPEEEQPDNPTPVSAPTPVETPTPAPSADNCVDCHTNAELLQQLAVEKVVESELGSGEG